MIGMAVIVDPEEFITGRFDAFLIIRIKMIAVNY